MPDMIWVITVMLIAVRLLALRRFWRLPVNGGRDRFLTVQLDLERKAREGAALLRRYRAWLFAPFLLDAVLVPLLFSLDRAAFVMHEQFLLLLLTSIFYRCVLVHFAYRASALAAPDPTAKPRTAVMLSLETRRLRDHTSWRLEAGIMGLVLAACALLARRGFALGDWMAAIAGRHDGGAPEALRPPALALVWLLYLQLGLLLLKGLYVRMRLKLPASRTDDFLRWRAAWLDYHLRVFDAVRLSAALGLLQLALGFAIEGTRAEAPAQQIAPAVWMVYLVGFTLYMVRERRRLASVEREVKPAELVREMAPTPVADGRFLAGGLLFFNRDSPAVLARSPAGVALNLANRTTYLWVAYLVGLVLLVVHQAMP